MTTPPIPIYYIYLKFLSQLCGWIYFTSWSLSFYGQFYLNYKRKSIVGFNLDFLTYNLSGFLAYTIYNFKGYFNNGEDIGTGPVFITDLLFSSHALLMTIFTIIQVFIYYDPKDESQKVSNTCKLIVLCIWLGYFLLIIIEEHFTFFNPKLGHVGFPFNHIVYLGLSKVFINMIKYLPQIHSNYIRKSTKGWSIFNVICDILGGSFCLAQNYIELSLMPHFLGHQTVAAPKRTNFSKILLGCLSVFFDSIFLFQHFKLYSNNNSDEAEDNIIIGRYSTYNTLNKNDDESEKFNTAENNPRRSSIIKETLNKNTEEQDNILSKYESENANKLTNNEKYNQYSTI